MFDEIIIKMAVQEKRPCVLKSRPPTRKYAVRKQASLRLAAQRVKNTDYTFWPKTKDISVLCPRQESHRSIRQAA